MIRTIMVGVLVVGACGKDVPLATTDAPPGATGDATGDAAVTDPGCDGPHQDGEPCAPEGLVCTTPAPCGVDTSTCLLGMWTTVRCEDTSAQRCPCLTNADCDPLAQCADDGLCVALLDPGGCGGAGEPCCGGACGSCGVGLLCTGGTCAPAGGGTLGAACTLACDGTSNCDPGQYCPESCTTCPCSDTCHPQASICTLGDDASCNDDPAMPALVALCQAAEGPFTTRCQCLPGSMNPATGKCK